MAMVENFIPCFMHHGSAAQSNRVKSAQKSDSAVMYGKSFWSHALSRAVHRATTRISTCNDWHRFSSTTQKTNHQLRRTVENHLDTNKMRKNAMVGSASAQALASTAPRPNACGTRTKVVQNSYEETFKKWNMTSGTVDRPPSSTSSS